MNIPMMWLAGGTVIGAILWSYVTKAFLWSAVWTGLVLLGLVLTRLHPSNILIGLLGIGVTGINMPHSHQPDFIRKHVVGTIVERQKYSVLIRTMDGLMRMHVEQPPPVGTRITALVQPTIPTRPLPGAYSNSEMEQRLGIVSTRPIAWTPVNYTPRVDRKIRSSNAEVIHALATGDRSSVSDSILRLMQRTGTIHLLAISGLHIGMAATVGALVGWLLSRPLVSWPRLARWIPTLCGVILAACYADIVGWPTSTKRAFCMVMVVGLTRILHRTVHPWHVWAMALSLVLTAQPHHIASVGLWMSFGAVAGLIGWTPLFTKPSAGWPSPLRWVWQSMSASTAATIGVLPVSAWIFQEISIGSPLSNLVAIPIFAGLAVPASMLAVHGPTLLHALAVQIADWAIWLGLDWMEFTNFGTVHPAVGGVGALLLAVALFLYQNPKWALIIATSALMCPKIASRHFVVTFPDIGQGGAALVEHVDGRTWLIDGGPPGKKLLFWLRRRGIHTIDTLFLTHPDSDHLGGLIPVLESLNVRTVWVPRAPTSEEIQFRHFWRTAAQRGAKLNAMRASASGNKNENSLVVQLRHGQHRFLLTGDIGVQTESNMLPHLQRFTVVQVPHHGSRGSSSASFVDRVRPDFAVIQAGRNNPYGHPHPDVVTRWKRGNVLQTNDHGTIVFRSDGTSLQVTHQTGGTNPTASPFSLAESIDINMPWR